MRTVPVPIKRSAQLAPLSREHHESLLFSWKIRQGLKFGTPFPVIAAYCTWFMENHFADHFRKEEKVFADILPREHPMMVKMIDDHEAIQMLVRQLSEFQSEESFERLAKLVGYHVRYEEREMFNHIEEIASPEQMKQIEAALSLISTSTETWTETFWMKSK